MTDEARLTSRARAWRMSRNRMPGRPGRERVRLPTLAGLQVAEEEERHPGDANATVIICAAELLFVDDGLKDQHV